MVVLVDVFLALAIGVLTSNRRGGGGHQLLMFFFFAKWSSGVTCLRICDVAVDVCKLR